jgi:outer membrane protein assembly factor BamE (lipoprotein component of BamABCDE complex)
MNKLFSTTTRTATALALAIGALGAQAAAGVTVLPKQETLVQPGMTQDEVRAAIGRPASHERYALSGLSTWRYETPAGQYEFTVDFGQDGRVTAATEAPIDEAS